MDYAAPEIFDALGALYVAEDPEPSIYGLDVYSFGKTIYDFYEGFPQTTAVNNIIWNEGATQEFKDFLCSCLERDPAARPSVQQLIDSPFVGKVCSSDLFSKSTQALVYDFKQLTAQHMLAFDHLCGREIPSIAGIVNPSGSAGSENLFFGEAIIEIPLHSTIEDACAAHPTADVFINFASSTSAAASSMYALQQPTIRVVAIVADDVPEAETKTLIAYAHSNRKVILGPGIQAGAFCIGDTGGSIENMIQCKLHRPGSIGLVSNKGGMCNEIYNTIACVTDGIYEGIAIGDVFPGSTLTEHILRFNNIHQVKIIVVLGELGGQDEYPLVETLKEGKVDKPVVAWVQGAQAEALMEAGAIVTTSYETFEASIKGAYDTLVENGKISPLEEVNPPQIPEQLKIYLEDEAST